MDINLYNGRVVPGYSFWHEGLIIFGVLHYTHVTFAARLGQGIVRLIRRKCPQITPEGSKHSWVYSSIQIALYSSVQPCIALCRPA